MKRSTRSFVTVAGAALLVASSWSGVTAQDPVKGRLVELRYFAGLTGDEAASVLGIAASTADRHWAYARAWLQAELRGK